MSTIAKAFAAAACVAVCFQPVLAQPVAGAPAARKSSLGMKAEEAAEVLLREVCMAGKFDGQSIPEAAKRQAALEQSAKLYNGGPNDKVYRMGPIGNPTFAVDWADGTCSARVRRGDASALRAMAERVILARPEGFTRGRHGAEDEGRVVRTVYCAFRGPNRLVASITTPGEKATRATYAFSSTVYMAPGPSPLCAST